MNKKKEILYLVLSLLGALIVIGGVIGVGAYFTYTVSSFLCAAIILFGCFLLCICYFYILRSFNRLSNKKKKQSEYTLYEFKVSDERLNEKLKDYKVETVELKDNTYEVYYKEDKPSMFISYIIAKDLKQNDIAYISNDVKNIIDRYFLGQTNVIVRVESYEENFINTREMLLKGILVTYVSSKKIGYINVLNEVESYENVQSLLLDAHLKLEDIEER